MLMTSTSSVKKISNSDSNKLLQEVLDNMNDWCLKSGAKISSDNAKKLHICRKRLCNHNLFTINIKNNVIKNVESLKILGKHFSKKQHYISLKKSLVQST